MKSAPSPPSAIFKHNLHRPGDSSSKKPSKYYRTNWEGVELPRQPSLKLIDDESFFQRISSSNHDKSEKKNNRYFDFVPIPGHDSKENQALAEQECEVSAKKHAPVPLHIRKLEIELVQRKLPRYPSYTHLSEPSFYPRTLEEENDLVKIQKRKKKKKKKKASPAPMNEDHATNTTDNDDACLKCEKDRDMPKTAKRRKKKKKKASPAPTAEDHDLRKKQERKEEEFLAQESLAQMDEDHTTITDNDNECLEYEEDHDLPKKQERKEEASLAQMDEDHTTTTDNGNECLEFEEDHDLPKKQERKKEEFLAQMDEDHTTTIDNGNECLEYEEDHELPQNQQRKEEASLAQMDEDHTTTTDNGNECLEYEEDHELPKNQQRKEEISPTPMKEDDTTIREIENECSEDEEDHHLPKNQQRKEEISPTPMKEDDTTTTETENECSEDEEDHHLSKNRERKEEISTTLMKEDDTTITETENECSEDEEGHYLPKTQERKTQEFSVQIDEGVTSKIEIEIKNGRSEDKEDRHLPNMQERKAEVSSVQMNEDDTNSTEIEIEYSEDESEYFEESYYSDCSEDRIEDHSENYNEEEVDIDIDDIFQDLLRECKVMHSKNIEYIDQRISNSSPGFSCIINDTIDEESSRSCVDESSCVHSQNTEYSDEQLPNSGLGSEEIKNGSINGAIRESSRSYVYGSSFSSIVEDEPYEFKIGFMSLKVRGMIFQGRMESRCRKVPEEHKTNFQPALAQASVMGRATRLDEYTVEAWGRNFVKYDSLLLPSDVWVKGEETVSVPHFQVQSHFQIFKEAVALGGMKALKPKITTNYDPFLPMDSSHYDEVDVDDTTKSKRIRIKFLTDIYVHQDYEDRARERLMHEDDDLERVHYESLDDVKLPTSQCPVYQCVPTKATELEKRESVAQQVAEAVWDRRYRLERPRAQQRITYRCNCKYCKTSSPYQTFAYRKKWLIQQNLLKKTSMNNSTKETDLNATSRRTASTQKCSIEEISHFGLETSSDNDVVERSDDISVNTGSSSDIAQSHSFAVEEFEFTENDTSVTLDANEDRFNSEKPPVDMDVNSSPSKLPIIIPADEERLDSKMQSVEMDEDLSLPKIPSIIPARPMPEDKKEQKVKARKTFMREIQSALGLSPGSKRASLKWKKAPSKRKSSKKDGIKSERSVLSNSLHDTESSHSFSFARAA